MECKRTNFMQNAVELFLRPVYLSRCQERESRCNLNACDDKNGRTRRPRQHSTTSVSRRLACSSSRVPQVPGVGRGARMEEAARR